jgi:hypothetical protein
VQRTRNNIINVSDEIIDIKTELIFGNSALYILDDILIVLEKFPRGEKGIHLFNKNTFEYITSTGIIGNGPGEITNPGPIGIDDQNRVFWVPDAGKKVFFKFLLDSVIADSNYKPSKKIEMGKTFMLDFGLINDSIVLGKAINMTSNSSYDMRMSKLNIYSNSISKFGYENPKATEGEKSYSSFALSIKNNLYVNGYNHIDLMTICDLNGNLISNVYGPNWLDNEKEKQSYFFGIGFTNSYIIGSYIGGESIKTQGNIRKGAAPTKFLIFDFKGNFIKIIETAFEFESSCIDEENNRIIAYFTNRTEALGYFNIPK